MSARDREWVLVINGRFTSFFHKIDAEHNLQRLRRGERVWIDGLYLLPAEFIVITDRQHLEWLDDRRTAQLKLEGSQGHHGKGFSAEPCSYCDPLRAIIRDRTEKLHSAYKEHFDD